MISIIIPVLSKDEYYSIEILKQIKERVKEEYEIILLDWPEWVNEKWNMWVEQAKWEYIWIINNDIVILEWQDKALVDVLNAWYKIACPLSTVRQDRWRLPAIAPERNIVGWCFMMKKKDWIPIDSRLDIWFWDDWIYHTQKKNIGYAWIIHHFESKTINNPEVKEKIAKRIEQDKLNWRIVLKEKWWKDDRFN